ncbi:hypothetical protein PWEIH_11690 [Listeria weihenstephanensis FSL R9-0317]|uniref:Uncharacterized protein n=1 Tax=Listeria weihenstephanensis TaxID=1006155 RepID=A0A1S7FV58_9LIST|nr:hypothetical protein [Listeria weihenstephanensis]AQY51247.1 hypothetical protein UE46_09405 [Listeria weihenstephanensis]EUJ36817.1 hypothetical protein PWEIH_11690 [Listeria weihenstephanensis FSL R9-0317]
MRKIPFFTIIAIVFLAGGYYFLQNSASPIDVSFNFLVTQKNDDNSISGNIEGAGSKKIKLDLDKSQWKSVKVGNRYTVEARFYDKNKVSNKEKKTLEGPFWSNDANTGILANEVEVTMIDTSSAN